MEKRHEIQREQMEDLISGITERIASGHDPEQLLQLGQEQIQAAVHCLMYVSGWADAMLQYMQREGVLSGRWIMSDKICSRMCEKEGAMNPNKAILIQVQRLRGFPQDTIYRNED